MIDTFGIVERSYRALIEPELDRLGEERKAAQLAAATRAGDREQMKLVISMLCLGRYQQLIAWSRIRVDRDEAEDLVADTLADAMRAAAGQRAQFEGATAGEFFGWLMTIIKRKLVDRRRGKQLPTPVSALPGNAEGEAEAALEPAVEYDLELAVQYRTAHLEVAAGLSPEHLKVVELWAAAGLGASEIADRVNGAGRAGSGPPLTQANVHKIVSRYRERMSEKLGPEFFDA